MDKWRTALVTSDATSIRIRGYDMTDLMLHKSFADTVFLLHRGRLPGPHEKRLLDAILVSSADHGAGAPSCAAARLVASGNRQSFSAAVAAGILAIGDAHGGAGAACMEMIAEGLEKAKHESISIAAAAAKVLGEARATKKRLPGLGHRVHSTDPRVAILFGMAAESGIPTGGVEFMRALEAEAAAQIKPLPMNIDGALAAVLHDLGFPPAAGHLLFIVGRVAGLTAEVAEEYAREKPMRIKFDVDYDGEPARPLESKS